jgi:hypothetical protein
MAILSASTPFLIFMNVVINGRSNKGGAIARPRLERSVQILGSERIPQR